MTNKKPNKMSVEITLSTDLLWQAVSTDDYIVEDTENDFEHKLESALYESGYKNVKINWMSLYNGYKIALTNNDGDVFDDDSIQNEIRTIIDSVDPDYFDRIDDNDANEETIEINGETYHIKPMANLENADLCGADLAGIDMTGINLSGANLTYANLSGANLSYANLIGANLREANMPYANLSGAIMQRAKMRHTDLSYADLWHTNLSDADLSYAKMRETKLWYANMSGADLSRANLTEANLCEANLASVNFWNTDLHGVDMSGADGISIFQVTGIASRGNVPIYAIEHKTCLMIRTGRFWGTLKVFKGYIKQEYGVKSRYMNIVIGALESLQADIYNQ